MLAEGFETPILLLVFSRPDTTRQVFGRIREARPKKLYIAADGPRRDRPEEAERCREVRELVTRIDWDCELKTLFRETNLGCRKGSPGAITWFLDEAGEGIILEDDCVPHPHFFRFCRELLERYRDDARVMQVTGANFQGGWRRDASYSYYFSLLGSSWGWATWQRAWRLFDVDMTAFAEIKAKGYLKDACASEEELTLRMKEFDRVHSGKVTDSWSYQWKYSMLVNHGLAIIPNANLIMNIGFGPLATHTRGIPSFIRPLGEMEFPLRHPPFMIRDVVSDARRVRCLLEGPLPQGCRARLKRKVKQSLALIGLKRMPVWWNKAGNQVVATNGLPVPTPSSRGNDRQGAQDTARG